MAESSKHSTLTICIATRNRFRDLMQCLKSLSLLSDFPFEVIIVDDASDEPLSAIEIARNLASELTQRIKIIRHEKNKGYISTRNEMAQQARTPYLLSLDDDAKLFHIDAIHEALEILENDPKVGAVALSQANEDGTLLPDYMQPAPVLYSCYAPSFIGYGHILRRDLFIKLGGYREVFHAFGEEDEYCKRMLNVGFNVVYLPEAKVIHYHSLIGRNEIKRMRYGFRNKCFDAIYNEPILMLLFSVPLRFVYYRFFNVEDIQWFLKELTTNFLRLCHDRKPLRWMTYRQWTKLREKQPDYQLDKVS